MLKRRCGYGGAIVYAYYPPLFTPRGYCSIFTFLPINHHHSRVTHPVVAKEVGHGVLEVPCREGSRHPHTAPLITILTMSFAYYHISDTTCINPRSNTWCHTVVVIHFLKLEITYAPLTFAVKFQWRFFGECNLRPLIHRQEVLPCWCRNARGNKPCSFPICSSCAVCRTRAQARPPGAF